MPRLLIVDDEPGVQESLRMLFKNECEVTAVGSVDGAFQAIDATPPDVILLDLVMPNRSGLELLQELSTRGALPPVIVLSATRTVATAVEAMKLGAADYVTKPFEPDALRIKVRRLLERNALEQELVRLRDEVARRSRFGRMIGRCDAMQEVFRTVERLAVSKASVLIHGETGAGKELVARALHEHGPRADGPFVAVNCAAIPDTLIESELFGHEKGSFTGAHERRIGRFEAADGGTLFLDEIGELKVEMQAKLLRVLQERAVERVGGGAPIRVDVRFVAATNRDLERAIEERTFRSDLYFRINVVAIQVPPLRERRGDVRLLAEDFLERFRAEAGAGPEGFAPAVLTAFERYAWPGNVRELENVVERAVALANGPRIELRDLPDALAQAERVADLRGKVRKGQISIDEAVARFERALVLEALERAGWNQTRAAEALKTTRRLVKILMDRHGIAPPDDVPPVPSGTDEE
jgi:DNA-binding NtrC family response regulator